MKEQFVPKRFSAKSLECVGLVNAILSEYAAEGYRLTLRQVYYQMVARGFIPNTLQSYKRIGSLVSDARLAGLIDWAMIEDRGRVTAFQPHWDDPADIVDAAARQFAIDKWVDQDNYIEVMVEKDALSGILLPVCRRLDIAFTANRGYSSSSALYETGKRLADRVREGKVVWVLYLGDHDPSGIDMTRDIDERVAMFSSCDIQVRRLALNMDQIERLHPPENPAKETDSRSGAYMLKFGRSSWELDAVEPRELDRLVTSFVESLRDNEAWRAATVRENEMRAELRRFVDSYRHNGGGVGLVR